MSDNKVTNVVHAQQQNELLKTINNCFDSLVVQNENTKIPEPVFKSHFLNFFTGNPDTDPTRNVLAEWIGVAGTPTSAVDVVDPTDGSKVLFTVPPVIDTSGVNLGMIKGKGLTDLVIEYKLHGEGLPGAAHRFAKNVIDPKAKEYVPEHSEETKATQEWNKIFQFYNVKTDDQIAQEAKSELSGGDDLVYD